MRWYGILTGAVLLQWQTPPPPGPPIATGTGPPPDGGVLGRAASFLLRRGQLSSFSPRKFLFAISTASMVRMSTLVVLLRTSDRKLAFYAAIALKATELIIML